MNNPDSTDVSFLVHSFPKISETFILNQVVGLLDRNRRLNVFSEAQPDTDPTHEIIDKYTMTGRTTYTGDPETYREGLILTGRALPRLLTRYTSLRVVASVLRGGTSAPRRLSNLDAVLSEDPPDVYHAHFGTVGNSFLDVRRCREVPYVVSFYGRDASQLLREDPRRYDALFEHADAVTVLSNDMYTTLSDAGCPVSKLTIVPLCVDTARFSYRPRSLEDDEPVRLLTVARLVEKKGIEYAVRAVADLTENHEVEYYIAGDGERRERIESVARGAGVTDSVYMIGWQSQSEVAKLMNDAHLFVLPSVTAASGDKEGTPTVLLEAQSQGLPVVSTRHAGIPEIVADDESGILVPERDMAALSDALERLVAAPERWAEMGQKGRQRVEDRHSIPVVSDRLTDLYDSLR